MATDANSRGGDIDAVNDVPRDQGERGAAVAPAFCCPALQPLQGWPICFSFPSVTVRRGGSLCGTCLRFLLTVTAAGNDSTGVLATAVAMNWTGFVSAHFLADRRELEGLAAAAVAASATAMGGGEMDAGGRGDGVKRGTDGGGGSGRVGDEWRTCWECELEGGL